MSVTGVSGNSAIIGERTRRRATGPKLKEGIIMATRGGLKKKKKKTRGGTRGGKRRK